MNLILKLSKLCNLRCTYCYEYEQLADRARMPLDGLARFFESLAQHRHGVSNPETLQFVLHGGEPTLLPAPYLRQLVALQREHLGSRGISYRNALQSNLYRLRPETLRLLKELEVSLSVSTDVFGGARLTANGDDADGRVAASLDALLESREAEGLLRGAIAVLHAGNALHAKEIFEYFASRGLDFRLLPIFAIDDPAGRMEGFMLAPAAIVAALQDVALARISRPGAAIAVHPLEEYLHAAIRFLRNESGEVFDPAESEWALIIDTNGDVYNHGEAYLPGFRMGNVFTESFAAVLVSPGRRRALEARQARARVCESCEFDRYCSRIPMIEALPSERVRDPEGAPMCAVARPMIRFFVDLIAATPEALAAARAAPKDRRDTVEAMF